MVAADHSRLGLQEDLSQTTQAEFVGRAQEIQQHSMVLGESPRPDLDTKVRNTNITFLNISFFNCCKGILFYSGW